MKIKIYAIGKIKESYLKIGIDDYLKKIRPYCQIEIVEVNDEPIPSNPNSSEIEITKSFKALNFSQVANQLEQFL